MNRYILGLFGLFFCSVLTGQVTPYEYAVFMVEAYKNPDLSQSNNNFGYSLPPGWSYFAHRENPDNGYFGVVFINDLTNQLIIAHRGTEPDMIEDFIADKDIFLGRIPEQFNNDAAVFTQSIINITSELNPPVTISHCGHSLGGFLAQLCTAKFNHKAVVFDTPGAREQIIKLNSNLDINALDITSYMAAPHFINTTNNQVGNIFRIFPAFDFSSCLDPDFPPLDDYIVQYSISQHGKENLLKEFDQLTELPKISQQVFDWPDSGFEYYQNYDLNTYLWNNSMRINEECRGDDYIPDDIDISETHNTVGVIINGDYNSNVIWGATNFNDVVNGFGGDDFIYGFEGDDFLNGGEGNDYISYEWKSQKLSVYDDDKMGIAINLNEEICLKGDNGQDIVKNFENVIGTDYMDSLTGDENDNVLKGGLGKDELNGKGGFNVLEGGEEEDNYILETNVPTESFILDDDGFLVIDGKPVNGISNDFCRPARLFVDDEIYLLYLLSAEAGGLRIEKEGIPDAFFQIPNWQNGKFGITIAEGAVADLKIKGRRNRAFCDDESISVSVEAELTGCEDCPFEYKWIVNGSESTGERYNISTAGTFDITLEASLGDCVLSVSDQFSVLTRCCHDCQEACIDQNNDGACDDPDCIDNDGDGFCDGMGGGGGSPGIDSTGNDDCVTTPYFICVPIQRSQDPNEIIGPAGYQSPQWVAGSTPLPYVILFENDPDFATAPAQKVVIRLPLDEQIDPLSLRLGDFGFANQTFTVPPNATTFTQRLDVTNELGVLVDVTAGLDIQRREAFWIFQSIDPATGLTATLLPGAGLLQINDPELGNGEGFVSLNLQATDSAVTGDSLTQQASIIFDINAPLETNVWTNLVDAVPPVSSLNALPETSDTTAIWLEWSGADDTVAVGIDYYEIYVSKDGEPFYFYEGSIDTTALQFVGEQGGEYAFFVRAVDNVGNKEPLKGVGETTTTFRRGLSVSPLVYLQGAYDANAGLMRDDLRVNNLIPSTEPFTALGYTHVGGGGENVAQAIFTEASLNAVVDWVFLELRDKSDPDVVVATRSALLQIDGEVVDVDGVSPVLFANLPADDYYLVVKHRNHLGVMSAAPIALSETSALVDFTSDLNQSVGGPNGIADLGDGKFGLYSGDFNYNGQVQNTDYASMVLTIGTSGYQAGDFDLNGQVQNTDLQLNLVPNIGRGEAF